MAASSLGITDPNIGKHAAKRLVMRLKKASHTRKLTDEEQLQLEVARNLWNQERGERRKRKQRESNQGWG